MDLNTFNKLIKEFGNYPGYGVHNGVDKVSEKFILNSSAKKIFLREWETKGQPKKNILIIHGLGEHSGRYKQFAEFYIEKGIGVYALDLQGHGKSIGKRL